MNKKNVQCAATSAQDFKDMSAETAHAVLGNMNTKIFLQAGGVSSDGVAAQYRAAFEISPQDANSIIIE